MKDKQEPPAWVRVIIEELNEKKVKRPSSDKTDVKKINSS